MNLFNRKHTHNLAEIHQQIADITELQNQRAVAHAFNNIEEMKRCEVAIELAQKVLERMLERVSQ